MPLHTIITAAKTVSRARSAFSTGAAIITETISATSIMVTATASTIVPNGSPTRCATTSAWYTAAKTVVMSAIPAAAASTSATVPLNVAKSTNQANVGHVQAHHGIRIVCMQKINPARTPSRW